MANSRGISVSILNKEYQVVCPEGKENLLLEAAQHLDFTMRDIKRSGKVMGLEKLAVMAALNISSQLFAKNAEKETFKHKISSELSRLENKLEMAIIS